MESIFAYMDDLVPATRQKSFGGHAKILSEANGSRRWLLSYKTIVGECAGKQVHRYTSYRSRTTSKHIKSFLMRCGFGFMTVKQFYDLPLEETPKIFITT